MPPSQAGVEKGGRVVKGRGTGSRGRGWGTAGQGADIAGCRWKNLSGAPLSHQRPPDSFLSLLRSARGADTWANLSFSIPEAAKCFCHWNLC